MVFKQLLMKPSTRTSPSNDIYHHSASDSLPHHKPCMDIRGSTQYKNSVSIMPPAIFYHAFTMSGKQPIWCKQGQSQNTDLVFHIQLLSREKEKRYKILWTSPGLGPLVLNWWFECLSATWENQLPMQVWASEVQQCWSDSVCLMLNEFRAASES